MGLTWMLACIVSTCTWIGGYHCARVKSKSEVQSADAYWSKAYQSEMANNQALRDWITQDKTNHINEINHLKDVWTDGQVKMMAADKDVERAVFNDGVVSAILIERKNPGHWDLSSLQRAAWNSSESKRLLDEKP